MEGTTYRAFTYCRPRQRLLVIGPASRVTIRNANRLQFHQDRSPGSSRQLAELSVGAQFIHSHQV